MKESITNATSFPFGCCIEGKERPIVENDGWHGVSATMVMLQCDKNVELIISLVKKIEIDVGNGDCALTALHVPMVVTPLVAVVVAAGYPLPPSKHSFTALV